MLKWLDILKRARTENENATFKVVKTDEEWKNILSEEAYYVTRKKGTERPFSSEMCTAFSPGIYECVCCGTKLFNSYEKFDSGTGWPSFTQPIEEDSVAYTKDYSHNMVRIEATCNTCDAHLGHVFQDGPPPSGLRYCINALALKKTESIEQKVVIGGGCFWCTEAIFRDIRGVKKVESGYAGGHVRNPTYKEVCSELTGHAEVIQITYDPDQVTFKDLITIHLITHDPTTLNRQGADKGTQYRSIIFYNSGEEKSMAESVISEIQQLYENPVVTELKPADVFYKAEEYHQDYFERNPDQGYCSIVIAPKVRKFKEKYKELIKSSNPA